MSWNAEWTWKYDRWNYVNSDEAMLDDSSRPRDKFWFRLTPWKQLNKLDFWTSVKNFYLDQITGVWGIEMAWINGNLVDTIIPISSWNWWYSTLPLSTYWISSQEIQNKWHTYTKWWLKWTVNDKWGIIIPTAWSYFIKFYSEVYFDPWIWQTSFMVSLLNEDLLPYDRQTKVSATNPDVAGSITLQDFKAGQVLYLWWSHASASWKKALYIWTIIIFKLS